MQSRRIDAEIVAEMDALMTRVRELEKELGTSPDQSETPRHPRRRFSSIVRFTGDAGNCEARGVNLSDGGVCFDVAAPLCFPLAIDHAGLTVRRTARLVWIRELADGGCRVGFEFERPMHGGDGADSASGGFLVA